MKMSKWQRIETAPKEQGARFLVFGGTWFGEISGSHPNNNIVLVEWSFGEFLVPDGDYYSVWIVKPIHWMPLPEPPEAKK